jgi:UDP:flavonoid glycosyltransferase YjiC (YdhE family)
MGATLRAIDYACRDADGVLYTPLARGAGLVADARGVPSALVAVQPWVLSARLAHVLAAGARDAGSRRAAQLRLELATYWDPFREALAAIDPAYDPRRAARRSLARPAAIGVSPAVLPELDDLLPGVRLCGDWAPAEPPGWSPPSDLAEFVARPGPAPIAVGFSSHVDADPERLGAAAVAAARAEGRRTVLLTGWGGAAAPPAADVHVTDFVPHAWLYPRCAAVVHHGGAGTTAAAMRAGVPQVVTPFGQDQAFWADRVRALGVGAAAAPDGDALALRTALARASSPPAVSRAAALGGALAEEDGVDVAAEHLLGVLAAVPVGAGA